MTQPVDSPSYPSTQTGLGATTLNSGTRPTFGGPAKAGNYPGGVNADGIVYVNSGFTKNPANPRGGNYRPDLDPGVPLGGAAYLPQMVPASVYLSQLQQYYYVPALRPKYNDLVGQMQDAGLLPTDKDIPLADALDAYQQVLLGASYNQAMTPDQYLMVAASNKQFESADTQPRTTTDTSTNTTTSTDTVLTGKMDAKALLSDWYGRLLGRAPKDYELSDFIGRLNETERANPTVTNATTSGTTTSTTSADGSSRSSSTNSTSDRTQTGGMGAAGTAQLAEDYVKEQPTYAGTQANTTLMNWFEEAILGPSSGKVL